MLKASGYRLDQIEPALIGELMNKHFAIKKDFLVGSTTLLQNVFKRLCLLEMEGRVFEVSRAGVLLAPE